MRPPITHVLFDFFGTLVSYAPGGASSAARCAELVSGFGGSPFAEPRFTRDFDATFAIFEKRAQEDQREFSMREMVAEFLRSTLDREPSEPEVVELTDAYIAEWNAGVAYQPAVPAMVGALAGEYRLAVVSNTHEPDLVPAHIAAMGLTGCFETVLTSVDFGWRKPHPAVYAEALARLGIRPEQAAFVGDTYDADFVGPRAAGMSAYLIDPAGRHGVPDRWRLRSIDELPVRLAASPETDRSPMDGIGDRSV
jgi:putative hydrolase of the HAD superfamily